MCLHVSVSVDTLTQWLEEILETRSRLYLNMELKSKRD